MIASVDEAASTTVTDVNVTMLLEMIFPDGSWVTSRTLVTVLGVGPTVTSAIDADVLLALTPKPPMRAARADAASDPLVVELVDVEDDAVETVVVDGVAETVTVEGVAETVTVDGVAETVTVDAVAEIVTVSALASETALPACGIKKLGAKLIDGCCSPGLQIAVTVPGPAQGKIRDGALLYRPMMVYANKIVLSKAKITAKRMKSGMGIFTPELRDRGGAP